MKVICLISILCLASGVASAMESANCEAARQIVEQYIALDLRGEGTHTSKIMNALIDYQDRDTPGWDSCVLTSESRIKSCKDLGNQVVVEIAHKVYGNLERTDEAELSRIISKPLRDELTKLRLNKTADGLKIDSPTVYVPHVGIAAASKMSSFHQP